MDVRIGITTSFDEGEQRLHRAYVQAVENAGGIPLIVPMVELDQTLLSFTRLLHGLVLTGGPAITDGLIGNLPPDLNATDPTRIRSDKAVLSAFLAEKKPVLGICYGMQLLNAVSGGTIYADVERQHAGSITHSDKRGAEIHPLLLRKTTHLRRILGRDDIEVNTRHVQAVAEVGSAYHVAATAPDGVIEAIENDEGTVLGVQFHPERMGSETMPIFRHLVENARKVA